MSQHSGNCQQFMNIALSAFNQYGTDLTLDQLAACLSVPSGNLHPHFNCKPELIRQLVSFVLTRVRQPPAKLSHISPAEELQVLLTIYSQSFTAFSQIALFDLKRHYPDEWNRIMQLREIHWQRIAATLETGVANGRLRPVDTNLFRMLIDGMLLDPFIQEHLALSELVDILLFGIARRAPRKVSFPKQIR